SDDDEYRADSPACGLWWQASASSPHLIKLTPARLRFSITIARMVSGWAVRCVTAAVPSLSTAHASHNISRLTLPRDLRSGRPNHAASILSSTSPTYPTAFIQLPKRAKRSPFNMLLHAPSAAA